MRSPSGCVHRRLTAFMHATDEFIRVVAMRARDRVGTENQLQSLRVDAMRTTFAAMGSAFSIDAKPTAL